MNANFARTIIATLTTVGAVSCTTMKREAPAPALREKEWVSYDGKVMPWKLWPVPKDKRVRAVLITVHGLSGATSDFWPIGEALPPRGVAVYGYEIRGQGNDPAIRDRGHIRSRQQWLLDLETFDRLVKERHPGVPVFWHGTSLGSLIALHAAAESPSPPAGLILDAPLAGLRGEISGGKRFLLKAASALFPRMRFSLGQLAGVEEDTIQVTSETTHGGQMAKTPHHVDAFSVRLLNEIGTLLEGNEEVLPNWKSPVLILASPQDVVATPEQISAFHHDLEAEDKTLIWFGDSRHLLLHDVEREEVVATEVRWILNTLVQKTPYSF